MPNNCRGMTLIEVLVAFVVLSLTMAVIMQIFSGGLRNAELTHDYSRALFLAESKLAAAGVEHPLVAGEESGQSEADLQWHVTIAPYEDGGETGQLTMPVRLYEVRVQVGWREGGRERRIGLATLRLGPKQ